MRSIPDNYRPVLTADQIEARIQEMADDISRDLMGESAVFVGVLKGAFVFLADLVRAMSVPVEIDFAQISSYGDETRSSGRITSVTSSWPVMTSKAERSSERASTPHPTVALPWLSRSTSSAR